MKQHLHGHFAFQVTSKIIDEKFLWWKSKEFLKCRICLRRPQVYLHTMSSGNNEQVNQTRKSEHINIVPSQSEFKTIKASHLPSSPPPSPS